MNWKDILSSPEEGRRLGLDIGSRSTKFSFNGELGMIDTTEFIYGSLWKNIPDGVDVVATGYGRNKVQVGRKIPEIRAHTVGAIRRTGLETFTLLDIGGQDFKVVRVEKKVIRDFHMNDKCAAGTGRFLEKMADVLKMDLSDLGEHEGGRKILESTCSVFTETELISLMMEGSTREELSGGVIHSVYERVRPYLRMFPADLIVFTGGVSRCNGLKETIEKGMNVDVLVPEDAQFMGALGCSHTR